MTASQTTTTSTTTKENGMTTTTTTVTIVTTTHENTVSNSKKRECLKNLECDFDADAILDLIRAEDHEGVQDMIESIIQTKSVQTLRAVAMSLGIEDVSGMVTHRHSDIFEKQIEYVLSHIKCDDDFCQGEKRSEQLAESFEDWNLMVREGEYFFKHQDPSYAPGELTMLEPAIVEGRAEAVFTHNALVDFSYYMKDHRKKQALMEDSEYIGDVIRRANRWLHRNS